MKNEMSYEEFFEKFDHLLERDLGANHNLKYEAVKKGRAKYHTFNFDFTNFNCNSPSTKALFNYLPVKIFSNSGKEIYEMYLATSDIMEAIIGWM